MSDPLRDAITKARSIRDLPPPAERRAIRQRAGLSTRDVAAALGMSRSSVSLYETGRRFPMQPTLTRYADLLARLRRLDGPQEAG